jgi:hypothetical protein
MINKSSRPLIEPWHPTPEEQKVFHATDATFEWLCHLPNELLRQYRGQWVAAKDCRIIAFGQTIEELHTNLGDTDLETVVVMRLERPGRIIYR